MKNNKPKFGSRLSNWKVRRAMHNPDDLVIELDYRDSKGRKTRRTVSPIRFVSENCFLALCLCREAPRQFCLERCGDVVLRAAHDVLMPVPMG